LIEKFKKKYPYFIVNCKGKLTHFLQFNFDPPI
jgi:hypothetical protein